MKKVFGICILLALSLSYFQFEEDISLSFRSDNDTNSRSPASFKKSCQKLINSFFDNELASQKNKVALARIGKLEGMDLVKKMDQITSESDLVLLWSELRKKHEIINGNTFKVLRVEIPDDGTERLLYLDSKTRHKIYNTVYYHPVASQCSLQKYDPTGKSGFCFGRAMAAHMEIIQYGVQRKQIRKIWMVGNLKTGANNWKYHVSTIVRGDNGEWWTIDPIFAEPLTVDEWFKKMKQFDKSGDAIMFTTQAKRFSPHSPSTYRKEDMMKDKFNNYFEDLLESYRDAGIPLNESNFSEW